MAVDNTHFKGSWRPEEDAALREAVARHGEKNWSTVARTFNQLMGRPPLLGRAPKQCRSRYLQQLVPGIKTGEWSVEEEEILVEGHKQFGNQWTLIASMLPGRTETSVKNHYNCTARRKVPTDPNRMTVLQRYLAVIGVITPPGTKSSNSKYPTLGSGYPNSNTGMYFQSNSSAAAAAAAAAAAKAASRRRGTSAPASAHSPSGSHMGYDEYEAAELAHAYSEADFNQAYAAAAAYQAYTTMEQQHHIAAAAAAAVQAPLDEEGEDEGAAEGVADGLLQLAHAAMLHLDEMAGQADGGDEDEEGAGSGGGEQHCTKDEDMGEAAAEDYDEDEQQQQHQQQHHRAAAAKDAEIPAAGSKAGSKSPAGRHFPAWLKPELALSVMSSEESDRTAEEHDEGSPLAEQLLRQHLKSGSKRSSPSATAPTRALLQSGAAPSKRPRSIWGLSEAAVDAGAAAGPSAALPSAAGPRFNRPVLDVSEPEGTSSCMPPPLSLPVEPASPALPSVASTSAPLSDLNTHLVAMLMNAFMGAADSKAASSPASALPPDALAAIARVMATTMGLQQQQQDSAAAPTAAPAALQAPASQMAPAPADA